MGKLKAGMLMDVSRRELIVALAGASATIILGAAWGFELLGGYEPCLLCRYQRIPYYAGMPTLLVSLVMMRRGGVTAARFLLAIAAAGFLAGAMIGVYQAGAEWRLWEGPTGCSALPGIASLTADELLARLSASKVASCAEASLRILGLSFAGWNALISGAVAAGMGWVALSRNES